MNKYGNMDILADIPDDCKRKFVRYVNSVKIASSIDAHRAIAKYHNAVDTLRETAGRIGMADALESVINAIDSGDMDSVERTALESADSLFAVIRCLDSVRDAACQFGVAYRYETECVSVCNAIVNAIRDDMNGGVNYDCE